MLPAEATTLRDRYAKLSTTEHDDPRTAYVHPDKAMFRTRYNQFLGIETAIRGRIPVQAMRPIDWEHPANSAFLPVNQPL